MAKIAFFLDLEWVDHSGCIVGLWKIDLWSKSTLGWEMAKELLKCSMDRTAWRGSRTTWAPIPRPHTKAKCDSWCQWLSVQTGGFLGLSNLQASSALNKRVCVKGDHLSQGNKVETDNDTETPIFTHTCAYTAIHKFTYIYIHTQKREEEEMAVWGWWCRLLCCSL